jgi:ubiquinone/menaquinone biosynthesis C-methylase UbiE
MTTATLAGSRDVNRFRRARGRRLAHQIEGLAAQLGRPITILDAGGTAEYWANVGTKNIEQVFLLNNERSELASATGRFVPTYGDACDLVGYADQSIDLVHSNSVIEHVGDWGRMTAFANEAQRVGKSGWIQTPAFEFPIEPHFRLPFIHWLGAPIRRKLLKLAPAYWETDARERRWHVDRINLLSRQEMGMLFPGKSLYTERFALLPKSYVVRW